MLIVLGLPVVTSTEISNKTIQGSSKSWNPFLPWTSINPMRMILKYHSHCINRVIVN